MSSVDPNLEGGENSGAEAPKSKIHLRRVLVDLVRRAWMVVAIALLAAGVAYYGGQKLSRQTFEAQTTLVYRLNDEKRDETDSNKNLLTLKSIVKVRGNLETVRNQLHLGSSLQEIGAAIDVDVEKNTNLMTITATWSTAEKAMEVANAARDAFLQNQVSIDRVQAQREHDAQSRRMAVVTSELTRADLDLQRFTNKNQITDFVSMARAFMEGYNSVDLLYQTALVEQETNRDQLKNLDSIVDAQKRKVAAEKNQAANTESLTDLSTRMERLRTAIHDDQETRARQADLALRQIELERLKTLYEQGAVAKKRVDEAQAAYDKQKALTIDTDQVKIWRAELDKLQKTVLPNTGATPSTQLLQEMLSKDFNLQLESVAIESKVASFKRARDDYDRKLASLPDLQRTFVTLSRRSEALEAEKKILDDALGKANRLLQITTPDFITVSPAKLPTAPKTSNRKTVTMMLGVVVGIFGIVVIIGSIFLDTRVKTGGDLMAVTRYPLLSELPALPRRSAAARKFPAFPPSADSELAVTVSALSRAVRRALPMKGARVAVAGISARDGASSVAVGLATALTRQRELVLLASLTQKPNAITYVLPEAESLDWVAAVDGEETALSSLVVEGTRTIPSVLPPLPHAVTADSITSVPMREALEAVSATYDVVVLDLLPASSSLQAELLGSFCDGVLLVARSLHMKREVVRRIERDFEAAGVPIIGWVLNSVPKMYQDLQ